MEVNRHPLTIDVVVLEILRHVSPSTKDLLAFRQVCRLWRQFATPIIASRGLELISLAVKMKEGKEETESDTGDSRNAESELVLSKYIAYMESDVEHKLLFSALHFNTAAPLDHPMIRLFLEGLALTVKKLYLNEVDDSASEGPEPETETPYQKLFREGKVKPEAFRRILLSFPNLEELVLGNVDPEGGEEGFLLPNDDFKTKIKRIAWVHEVQRDDDGEPIRPQEKFISDLLKVCPSLERFLHVEDSERRFSRALSQSPHLSSLKELTIPRGKAAVFQALLQDGLVEEKLRLKKLKFDDLWMLDQPEELCRFLDTQKSSLETLIVGEWTVDSILELGGVEMPQIVFPDVMKKLKVLKIADVVSYNYDEEPDPIFRQLLFQPLDFRGQFPVLKTLILGGHADRYDFNDLFSKDWEPQMVLEGLVLPYRIKYQDLGDIGDLFPNVKDLSLRGVEEDELRVLWTQWPLLESLFLDLDDVNIETALTGLLSQQIPLVQSLIENGEEINIQADNPSIVNFQNLKELRILELEEDKNAIVHDLPGAFLSDVCIHYSLSKLPKLEFLGVKTHRFTDEGINFLCNLNGLKWNKNGSWLLQCQKDLELKYKCRPTCDEDFADYKITWSR